MVEMLVFKAGSAGNFRNINVRKTELILFSREYYTLSVLENNVKNLCAYYNSAAW